MKKYILLTLMTLGLVACGSSGGQPDPGNPTQPMFDCQHPLGGIIKHGESVSLFKDSEVPYGQACQSEVRVCTNGVLSGSYVKPACSVLPEEEPATHEKPLAFDENGLKRGGIKELGSVSSWSSQNWAALPSPRPPENTRRCDASVVAGTLCAKGTPICRTDDKLFSCKTVNSRKVFGWVYEKEGPTKFKPFANVQVDFYRFTQCLLTSGCEPLDTVYTDKWGYFEYIEQGAFKDTLSTKSPSGYFGYCSLGKMIHVNGSNFAYALPAGEKAFGAFSHQKIKEDSCK